MDDAEREKFYALDSFELDYRRGWLGDLYAVEFQKGMAVGVRYHENSR